MNDDKRSGAFLTEAGNHRGEFREKRVDHRMTGRIHCVDFTKRWLLIMGIKRCACFQRMWRLWRLTQDLAAGVTK